MLHQAVSGVMPKPNGAFARILLLSLLTSMFSPTLMVFGSPVHEQKRPDPMRGLKNYNGGYNITNKHYWASAAFTGVHGYAIAAAWLLCGLGFGIFASFKYLKGTTVHDSPHVQNHWERYYFLMMFLLIILFTLLSIVATSCVLAFNESSLDRTKTMKGTFVKAGRDTRRSILKLVKVMTEMQHLLRPYDATTSMHLYNVSHQLANKSQKIQIFVKQSGHAIDVGIQTSYTLHLVFVTINLVLLVASMVVLLFHWQPGFIIAIFVCWILATVLWVLTGFDFSLYIFVKDACAAFHNFQQNPENSSLSCIIPCVDPTHSVRFLAAIGYTLHDSISQFTSKIKELYLMLAPDRPDSESLGLGKICNPFSGAPNYTYMPEICPQDAFRIGELPNILASFTCYRGNSIKTCRSEGKVIPAALYDMASAYSHSSQDMLDIFPDLESLIKCSIVNMTFSAILQHQCRPFKVSIRSLWASMLSLSIFMVILVLTWVAKTYQEKGRHFTKCSIIPNPL